jgi:hypothetical protein
VSALGLAGRSSSSRALGRWFQCRTLKARPPSSHNAHYVTHPPPSAVGAPVVDNCLSGFNSSIFAYGQTGAGKTYTMTGRIGNGNSALDAAAREQLGLAPRVFEYLFERIEGMQDQQVGGRVS